MQCGRLLKLPTRPDQRALCQPFRWRRSTLLQGTVGTASSFRSYATSKSAKPSALPGFLKVSEEVQDAVQTNKPVVALESTIYTHGALGDLGLEDIVRQHGGVPAVCGILAGVPTVGLTPGEIDRMVHESARKASRRDIAALVGLVSFFFFFHVNRTNYTDC